MLSLSLPPDKTIPKDGDTVSVHYTGELVTFLPLLIVYTFIVS